jgi:nucleoside-diphosphate-sugar epimerase
VSNVVSANLLACQTPDVGGQVFNASCGARNSLLDLVARLEALMPEANIRVTHLDPQPGDVRHSQAGIQKARDLLGYEPLVDFDAGLARTLEWYAPR